MCNHSNTASKLTELGNPKVNWAISAMHGDTQRLQNLHDQMVEHIQPGDRIIYLGNYMGHSGSDASCIDEILAFRRYVLAMPGIIPSDFVYLRGGQEEIWDKLMQLHFAPNALDVLLWMYGNGLTKTLQGYGISHHDGIEACRTGSMGITKWVSSIRKAQRKHKGHECFLTHLSQAAYTDPISSHPMLFVHSGLDDNKTLEHQQDNFWWGGYKFDKINKEYSPFKKIVRGYDPDHKGIMLNCISTTLDGGCGYGGSLIGTGFDQSGNVVELFEC